MNTGGSEFAVRLEAVLRIAPPHWIDAACAALRTLPEHADRDAARRLLPQSHNAELYTRWDALLDAAAKELSWTALAQLIAMVHQSRALWHGARHAELLWSGPPPPDAVAARRIDQVFYDLVDRAHTEIVLVTFAATRISRLSGALMRANTRGVRIRLILEFHGASEGQLSHDAVRAFPEGLRACAEIYYWPVEKRTRNEAGRPGKLHAKFAIIDDAVVVSSANLTDDAFTRNLELGALVHDPDFLQASHAHLTHLIEEGVVVRL